MNEIRERSARSRALLRWFVAAAFVLAIIASGLFSGLMNRAGLLFLVFGSVAAAFMGFSRHEIGSAFRHTSGLSGPAADLGRSAHFWEAAARNAWILGVLGSAINFAITVGSESGGIADVSNRMIQSFVVTLYGLVLAVLCLIPAMKIAGKVENGRSSENPPAAGISRPARLGPS
jgi:flagellar motor component MotA